MHVALRRLLVVGQTAAVAALFVLSACGGANPVEDIAARPTALAEQRSEQMPEQKSEFNEPGPRFPTSLDSVATPQNGRAGLTPRGAKAVAQDNGYVVDTASREAVRLFYKTVFDSSSGVNADWTGNLGSCSAGDTSADYKAATLRRINWFRAMAGVPATVQLDATFNAKAQQAALLMSANRQLSHFPPSNWTCFNATGFEAAGKSNIALGNAGIDAITSGYMRDPGANNSVVGHRRWVLYPQTRLMGTGDIAGPGATVSANALWVQDSNIFSTRPAVRDDFVAWPAKGYAPYTTVYPRWSFSYPDADFSKARVTITENGVAISSRLEPVNNGFGENTLVWIPGAYVDGMDWVRPPADTVYQITVSNVTLNGQNRTFTYAVTVFDPDQDATGGDANSLAVTGDGNVLTGQAASFAVAAVPGATDYQWRSVLVAPFAFNDGAESGANNFAVSISPGYSVTATDVRATGSSSFHLAHAQPVDQTLQLKSVLVGSANSVIRFSSRLGLSSPAQTAKLEASADEGKNWQVLYQQSGQQSGQTSSFGEASFSSKQVSLAQFADRSVQLRFRYEFRGSGIYYPQSSLGIGWYIDDIQIDGMQVQSTVSIPMNVSSNRFSFVPSTTGTVLLQAQAGMYGFYSDWGALKRITVSRQAVVDPRDCVLNWAERNFPALVAPAAATQQVAPYYFRFYSATQAYLGFSSADDRLYYLGPNGLIDGGHKAKWLIAAACQ